MGRALGAIPLALACLLIFQGPGSAASSNTWTAFGPSAAQVLALAASPDGPAIVYAATGDRVWKSSNDGSSWAATAAGPTNLSQSMVAGPEDVDDVVVAGTDCSVWVSSNGGSSWLHPSTRFNGVGSCTLLLAWSPSGLFALARGKIHSSSDGGLTWSLAGAPPDGDAGHALIALPTLPATLYVGTELGTVRLSTDGGATWNNRSEGLPTSTPGSPFPPSVNQLAVDPADGNKLYAEVDGVGLFRTNNGGLSWEAANAPSPAAPASLPVTLATSPTTLVAVAGTSAFRSTDGGTSWVAATRPPGGLGNGTATGFLADPSNPNDVYMSGFGVYRSLDAGSTFSYSGNGLDKAIVHAIVPVAGSAGSYLVATEGVGVQRTDDSGEFWQVANEGVVGQTLQLAAHPSDGDVFFLEAGGHLWKTTDGAGNWATSDSGIPYGASAVAIDPSSPATVYTAVNRTVYRSTDSGSTWVASTLLPGQDSTRVRRLAVDPTDGDRVYAGTNAGFYRSTDAGTTWTRLHTDYVTDLLVARDGDAFVGVDYTVRRFGPTSATPTSVSTLPDILQAFGEAPDDPETVYVGTLHGVYQSVDGGGRWAKLTTAGLDSEFITDIASVSSHQLMVGTPRGTAAITLASPTATAANADNVTTTSARLTGAGSPGGLSATAFFEYGPTVGYGSTTTATAFGSGDSVELSAAISGLSPGATYHYRLVVQSGGGIAVTPDATFTTAVPAPSVSTGSATLLTSTSARLAGSVNPNGGATSYWFEYGMTTAYGHETTPSAVGAGAASLTVQAVVATFTPATTYHYRLVAQSPGGTSFGVDRQVAMPNPLPLASTGEAAFVTSSEALLQGSVNPNGEGTSYWFEYGTTLVYGQVTPAVSAGAGFTEVFVAAALSDLAPSTTYHFRLLAESARGTTIGADREFSTRTPPAMGEVSAPVLRPGRLVDGAVPLGLSWSATPGSSEICTYDIGSGSEASPITQIGVVDTTGFSTSSRTSRGLYYGVRAVGCDGSSSALAESSPVDLRLLQESTTALRRGPGWTRLAASDASGGRVLTTTTRDARLTLSFTGRSLALVAPKGPRYGSVLVSVDGGAATRVDLYRGSRAAQWVVYVVNFPSAGNHKALVRTRAADSRRRVAIDAFAIVG